MKKKCIAWAACLFLAAGSEVLACTGLLVGKKASTDGSVMISYSADSHTLYGEMYRWPAATYPQGTMTKPVCCVAMARSCRYFCPSTVKCIGRQR